MLGTSLTAQSSSSGCGDAKCNSAFTGYKEASPWGRYTIIATKAERGTSKLLDMDRVAYLCGDLDGCQARMVMHDWDPANWPESAASREFLMFYNPENGTWRASIAAPTSQFSPWINDPVGVDLDGTTAHINRTWACHLTDGEYKEWRDQGDRKKGISLLNWNNDGYNGNCWLTLID